MHYIPSVHNNISVQWYMHNHVTLRLHVSTVNGHLQANKVALSEIPLSATLLYRKQCSLLPWRWPFTVETCSRNVTWLCIYYITVLIYCCVLTVYNALYKFVNAQRDVFFKIEDLQHNWNALILYNGCLRSDYKPGLSNILSKVCLHFPTRQMPMHHRDCVRVASFQITSSSPVILQFDPLHNQSCWRYHEIEIVQTVLGGPGFERIWRIEDILSRPVQSTHWAHQASAIVTGALSRV